MKQPHYKRISLHIHPVLHLITLCYIRSAVVLLGLPAYAFSLFTILGLSSIAISDPILAKDVTLDCSKACICFVHRSRHIYFTSWLNNIDEFRCSTAEIASITTMFWTSSTILCQVYAGYLYHHPANWIFDGSNCESALDLVKKTERAMERYWTRTTRRKHPDEIHNTFKVGFVSIYISSNLSAKTLFTKCR